MDLESFSSCVLAFLYTYRVLRCILKTKKIIMKDVNVISLYVFKRDPKNRSSYKQMAEFLID